ncbi:MAG: hypothetical protein WEB90_04395 [Gemmatimonadota bacterium]
MVRPPRRQLASLGGAVLFSIVLASEGVAQHTPPSAEVSMQARVTIVPAVVSRSAPLALLADFSTQELAAELHAAEAQAPQATSPSLRVTEPIAYGALTTDGAAIAGPPILRTLEWGPSSEDRRLVRYVVAVIS